VKIRPIRVYPWSILILAAIKHCLNLVRFDLGSGPRLWQKSVDQRPNAVLASKLNGKFPNCNIEYP